MSSRNRNSPMYVELPKVYGCEVNGKKLSCIPIKKVDNSTLLEYCENNPDARVLVRYPIGQHDGSLWRKKVETVMEVVMSESFDITKPELKTLLKQFYTFNKYMQKSGAIEKKLENVWDEKGRITIYIVKIRSGDSFDDLKEAKKFIRAGYNTMHILHTSDNQEETLYFARHIFTEDFLKGK